MSNDKITFRVVGNTHYFQEVENNNQILKFVHMLLELYISFLILILN